MKKRLFCSIIIGKEAINKEFAGVGRPIKFSVCLVSILNFANLRAENTAIRKAE
jgi:hypothetical protein